MVVKHPRTSVTTFDSFIFPRPCTNPRSFAKEEGICWAPVLDGPCGLCGRTAALKREAGLNPPLSGSDKKDGRLVDAAWSVMTHFFHHNWTKSSRARFSEHMY